MPFDISKVPFYRAVTLFEAQNYQDAFSLFIDCAKRGNLHAPFYLEYLLQHQEALSLKIPEEHQAYLKGLNEYIALIPIKNRHPNFWCKASVCLIKLQSLQSLPMAEGKSASGPSHSRKKARNTLLVELDNLRIFAPNAAIHLLKLTLQNSKNKVTEKIKILNNPEALLKDIFQMTDVYVHYHLAELQSLSPKMQHEWIMLNKFEMLAYGVTGGAIESILYKDYEKSGSDIHRKILWVMTSAYMGYREAQKTMLKLCSQAQEKDAGAHMRGEMDQWIAITAHNGDPLSQAGYGLICCNAKKYDLAVQFLEKAAEKKLDAEVSARVYSTLGQINKNKLGGFKGNDGEALKYYQKGAEINDAICIAEVSFFHSEGRGGLSQNFQEAVLGYTKAIEILEKSAKRQEKTIAGCHSRIAALYCCGGYGIEQDFGKAAAHYKIGLAGNNLQQVDYCNYGQLLLDGKGTEKNIPEGIRLLLIAAERGSHLAACIIGRRYVIREIPDPMKLGLSEDRIVALLKFASENKDVDDCDSILGMFYLKHLETPNYERAIEHFKLGALKNESVSIVNLGYFYEHGCPAANLEKDPKKAFEYYQIAVNLNNTDALNNLGFCFMKGIGTEQNFEAARTCFLKGIALGSKITTYNLYIMYRDGLGVKPDLKQAIEYLYLAEGIEDDEIHHNLGVHYYKDILPRDLNRACYYFEKALKKGNTGSARNYVIIKLTEALRGETLSEALIRDFLDKLKPSVEKGYSIDIFYSAMLRLLLDQNELKSVLEELTAAVAIKPHKASSQAITCLNSRDRVTLAEVLVLLTSPDPVSAFEKLAMEKTMGCDSTVSSDELNAADKNANKGADVQKLEISKLNRLKQEVSWFIDPKNSKSINLQSFKALLGKISLVDGMMIEIISSKSSNVRFHISHKEIDKTLCYSYHPTHRSGSGQDAEYDPNRARSLQEVIRTVAVSLNMAV